MDVTEQEEVAVASGKSVRWLRTFDEFFPQYLFDACQQKTTEHLLVYPELEDAGTCSDLELLVKDVCAAWHWIGAGVARMR